MLNQMTKHICTALIVVVILSGCVSYPSGMTELGTESLEKMYTGEATYVGWYGLDTKSKPEVYREALAKALEAAGTGVDELENVQVWTTDLRLGGIAAGVSSAAIMALAANSRSLDSAETTALVSLAIVLLSGLEVQTFTVTGTMPE